MSRPGIAMVTLVLIGGLLLLGHPLGGAFPSPVAEPEAEILARVDGESVTIADLEELLEAQEKPPSPGERPRHLSPEGVLKRLIQNRLLEQEGYRIAAQEAPDVERQVWDLVRHRSMMALLDSISSTVPKPDASDFDSLLSRSNTMFRVSHILVEDEAHARALMDSLDAGTPFADLAQRHSRDSTWAGEGGDLGWGNENAFIPEFRTALAGLSEGDVAGPVQTERGWHLLMLTETRTETLGQSERMVAAMREAAMRDRVMKTVRSYVMSLREKYAVAVDSSLLASLDYGSEDSRVQSDLRESDAVLAVLPWRNLTVSGLTRNIRFEHFHGLQGKPDAPEIRDRLFEDWLTEALLRHEASVLGFNKRPDIVSAADDLERRLVRDAVINMILDIRFEPSEEEVEAFYASHIEDFTPEPRIRAEGALLENEGAAHRFRQKLEDGAGLDWLAARTPEVRDPDPAIFSGWLEPDVLGVSEVRLEKGAILGPMELEGMWAVAKVLAVETADPVPLDQCRDQVMGAMKNDRMHEAMRQAISQLESQAEIEVLEGALGRIEGRIDEWLGTSAASLSP